MNKKRVNLIVSLIIGLAIFGFFLYRVGLDSISSILSNINLFYLALFSIVTTLEFFPTAWRWQIILRAHKKKVSFWAILKYTIAGYAVSYVTPMVNAGGEPVRAYMLKKEQNVDLKTGSSSIIIDKFVELLGAAVFGFVGLILFLTLPQLSSWFKILLGAILLFTFYLLFLMYYRIITGKGSFSSLFVSLRLYKIARLKDFVHTLEDVEKKLEKFFINHKKEFLLSCGAYALYGVLVVLDFKLLLLSFGIDESIKFVILAVTVFGLANFMPVPASLGVLEAGETTLFSLIKSNAGIGFALSLLIRLRALIFVAIGFAIITYFGGKQIEKNYQKSI